MDFIDTQIIISVYNQKKVIDITNSSASSIVISEFLRKYIKGNYSSSNFYPRLLTKYMPYIHHKIKTKRPIPGKNSTDKIIFNFNGQHPSFVEYSNLALHVAIKNKNKQLLLESINHFPKKAIKEFNEKINFLFDLNINCVPLNDETIRFMLNTLYRIEKEVNFKDNFRNSINDLLIAATAKINKSDLYTEDKLLNKIIANFMGFDLRQLGNNIIQLEETNNIKKETSYTLESKGYINQSWRYRIQNSI